MEFRELVAGLAEKLGNPSLAEGVEDAWGFEVDGMTVVARMREDQAAFTLDGDMGAPPPEGRETFERTLLSATADLMARTGCAFAIGEGDRYRLVSVCDHRTMDLAAFAEKIEAFVNELERWRTVLGEYAPRAATLERAAETEALESRSFSLGGFLQV